MSGAEGFVAPDPECCWEYMLMEDDDFHTEYCPRRAELSKPDPEAETWDE